MMRLCKFRSLSQAERRFLLRATLQVLKVRLMLWCLPFFCLKRLLAGEGQGWSGKTQAEASGVERIIWAVEVAARYVPRATCLTQALAARKLLHQEGFAGELRLGVAKDEAGRFQAHAWLEQDGRVLLGGGQQEHYTAFDNLGQLELKSLRA
jgi:hypothetical protein